MLTTAFVQGLPPPRVDYTAAHTQSHERAFFGCLGERRRTEEAHVDLHRWSTNSQMLGKTTGVSTRSKGAMYKQILSHG